MDVKETAGIFGAEDFQLDKGKLSIHLQQQAPIPTADRSGNGGDQMRAGRLLWGRGGDGEVWSEMLNRGASDLKCPFHSF